MKRQEEGQKLIFEVVNLGEKAARTTKSDGKDVIHAQLSEVRSIEPPLKEEDIKQKPVF